MSNQSEEPTPFEVVPPDMGFTLDEMAGFRARSDDPAAINQAKKEILSERRARTVSDFSQSFIDGYDDLSNKIFTRNLHEVQEGYYQRDDDDKDYQDSWSYFIPASQREEYRIYCAEKAFNLFNSLNECGWLINDPNFILAKEEFIKREPAITTSCMDKDFENTPLEVQLDLAFMRVVTGGLMVFYSPEKYEEQLIDIELISPFRPSDKSQGFARKLKASLRADGIQSRTLDLSLGALGKGDLPPKDVDPVRYNEKVWTLSNAKRRDLLIRECDLIGRRLFDFPEADTERLPAEIIERVIEITGQPSPDIRTIRRKLEALEKLIEPEEGFAYGLRRIKNLT